MEVSAKTASSNNKTQMLAGEGTGAKVREDQHKNVGGVNLWCIELATEPSAAEPIAEAPKYDGA